MALTELTNQRTNVDFGNDAVVCPQFIAGIAGGRSLDVTGFDDSVVKAGHVIIKDTQKGDYKPMPISSGNYGTLPENHEYVGILYKSIPTDTPMASIMTHGLVNSVAAPYKMDTILEAFQKAVPFIDFVSADEDK